VSREPCLEEAKDEASDDLLEDLCDESQSSAWEGPSVRCSSQKKKVSQIMFVDIPLSTDVAR